MAKVFSGCALEVSVALGYTLGGFTRRYRSPTFTAGAPVLTNTRIHGEDSGEDTAC